MARLPERMESADVLLRPWTESDVDLLEGAVTTSIEHLRPWMPWVSAEPMERSDRLALIQEWQRDWRDGGDVVVGAFVGTSVVGGGGLHRRVGPRALEIGYWVHAAHLRRGIATNIAHALTEAAFTVSGIERVEIHHDKANTASRGIPERLGYTLVGEWDDQPLAPAEVGVECRWAISRDQWFGHR